MPPLTEAIAAPVLPLKQFTFVKELILAAKGDEGITTATVAVATIPLASVMLTV